jgi:flavin-dependent dehydrogenase
MQSLVSRLHYDVAIVGARCAGAALAMLLARSGLSVLAIDWRPYGSDTLSTHVLMRPAVLQLSRWGLLPALRGTPLIRKTVFHYGADAVPVDIRPDALVPGLLAPRRTLLDRVLVDAAREAGAEIRHGLAMQDLLRDGREHAIGLVVRDFEGRTAEIRAGLVVGADGIGSAVAHAARAPVLHRGSVSAATMYTYLPSAPSQAFHWHFLPGMAGGAIPTNGGETCYFVSTPERQPPSRLGELLAMLMPEPTRPAPQPGRVRSFRGAPGFLRAAHGPGWALVGDAGFFRDPITSHGISDAFRDADLLAHAVLADSHRAMQRYQEVRDEIARQILAATDAIASFDWRLDELDSHHRAFSRTMKQELALLSAGPEQAAA